MIAQENKYTNLTGVFPNALMIDASGAGLTDGSEFAALPLNDGFEPLQQAIMDYAAGNQNSPTGSVGVPNGVADAAGVNQFLQAIQKAHGIGPGKGVIWFLDDDPSVSGDRVLLLSGQGVLITTYPALSAAVYVGDGNNAAVAAGGGAFFKSTTADGLNPNIAGTFLILPDAPGRVMRVLDSSGSVDPDGASRFLGDVQDFNTEDLGAQVGMLSGTNTIHQKNATLPSFTTDISTTLVNAAVSAAQTRGAGVAPLGTAGSETRMTNISMKLGIIY